jgi:hypothetical protein
VARIEAFTHVIHEQMVHAGRSEGAAPPNVKDYRHGAIRVAAWNVRQGGGSRCPRIAAALQSLDADVAVLSEHRPTDRGRLATCLREAGFDHQLTAGEPTGGHTGLLIASRSPIEPGPLQFESADDGHRFLHVRVGSWDLAGCYIPGVSAANQRKAKFWSFLRSSVAEALQDKRAVLIGDLNTACTTGTSQGARWYALRTWRSSRRAAGGTPGRNDTRSSVRQVRGGARSTKRPSAWTTRCWRRKLRERGRSPTHTSCPMDRRLQARMGYPTTSPSSSICPEAARSRERQVR